MLVKDASSQMTKNFYRLILFSGVEDSEINFFTGMPGNKPCNLYQNEEALQVIEKHVRLMLRYNVWIEALIERKGVFFLLKDTQIKTL